MLHMTVGQSISIAHLAPFVEESRKRIRKDILNSINELKENEDLLLNNMTEKEINYLVNKRLKKEIEKGVQIIQYQVVTLMTTNGQAPFVSVFMYLNEAKNEQEKEDIALIIEEILKQRIQGVKNEAGQWVTPAFPKLLYVLEEDNINENGKYFYLTQLAAKCTAKRMVPDYISEKKMLEYKEGNVFPCMGCRSMLSPYKDETGKMKFYGRFNQGVVTINLVDVACSSEGDEEKFWKIFDERLNLCHRALRLRHERLLGTLSDISPIVWQHGGYARLKKGETIDKLLVGGYSTLSLGYAGLYECVMRMKGVSHTEQKIGYPFAIKVMEKLNEAVTKWKKEENVGYALYGSPIESTTYKFAKCLKKRFGEIKDVTDHNYITNSYHVNVREKIDAFTKLKLESNFQKLSLGGCISYVEVPNMEDNIEAVISVLKYIYENTMYAELNTKSDFCQKCGYSGEIVIKKDENKKLYWCCPNCGNTDQSTMNVARRTCGLIIGPR